MRKVLISLAVLIVIAIALGAAWIFAGPKVSLFLDKYGTAETKSEAIRSIRYEGNGTGGVLYANDIALSLNSTVPPRQPPSVGLTKDGKLALAVAGKVFPFGVVPKTADENAEIMTATPENGDNASVSLRHSALSWPTVLEFNFMTGNSPTWKRHRYSRLTWQKSRS